MRVSIIPRIVKKLRQLIGIVQDTDTATRNIEEGKYVVWKGSLCKSTTAITTGDTLSNSNLEAVADGGLNVLNSNGDAELIISKEHSSSSYSTYNLDTGKKFSDYRYVLLICGTNNNEIRVCSFVPISVYAISTHTGFVCEASTPVPVGMDYVSDTSVKFYTNSSVMKYFRIYGIK